MHEMEGEVVFAFVDILGPCRELFGNLLSDFVETLVERFDIEPFSDFSAK